MAEYIERNALIAEFKRLTLGEKMSRPYVTSRQIAPCKGCSERYIACHDHCERFKKYKAIRKKENEARRRYEGKPFVCYTPLRLLTNPKIIDKIVYTGNCMHYFSVWR